MSKKMEIKKGMRVRITSTDAATGYPITVTGTVKSATNWGSENNPDWYIELTADGIGYMYWKQGVDGGSVSVI